MEPKILLTGRPGCGKTTLIRRVVNQLRQPAGGFYTEEMREGGTRVGFKLVTLAGEEAVFAHVDFKTPERVRQYGLDLSALEAVGVKAVREAIRMQRLVVIDEIGPMEIRSQIFRDTANEALDSPETSGVVATIAARPLPFIDSIRTRRDVSVMEVRTDNRDRLVSELLDRLKRHV